MLTEQNNKVKKSEMGVHSGVQINANYFNQSFKCFAMHLLYHEIDSQ